MKLGKEEGAHLLIPQEDLVKLNDIQKVSIDDFSSKITEFEDKKRQKIQFLKEVKDQKEIEECKFAPEIMTRKKGEPLERRNLDQFLEDQRRFDEMKKQKMSERKEEYLKS